MKSHLSILIRFHQQTLFLHRKSGVNHNFHITNETLINGIYFLIDFAVLWHCWIMRCSRLTEMGWRGKDWQHNMNVSSHCINGFFWHHHQAFQSSPLPIHWSPTMVQSRIFGSNDFFNNQNHTIHWKFYFGILYTHQHKQQKFVYRTAHTVTWLKQSIT